MIKDGFFICPKTQKMLESCHQRQEDAMKIIALDILGIFACICVICWIFKDRFEGIIHGLKL